MSLPNARKSTAALALLTALLLASVSVHSHHSAGRFDFSQRVEITGEIRELAVENPHIHLVLEVSAADGGTKEVSFEGHSRNNVYRRGWRPDAMGVGDEITVEVAPRRDGEDGGYVQRFILADGTEF